MTINLDHAATTPMSATALAAYVAAAEKVKGNASSLHKLGRQARQIVEDARESIAADLGAHPTEVVFTHGGTEANNLAIKGIYWASENSEIAISEIEHHSIINAVNWLIANQNAILRYIPGDQFGFINPSSCVATNLPRHPAALTSPVILRPSKRDRRIS